MYFTFMQLTKYIYKKKKNTWYRKTNHAYGNSSKSDLEHTWWKMYIILQISDPEKCDQMYESLARINSNVYKEKVSLKWE